MGNLGNMGNHKSKGNIAAARPQHNGARTKIKGHFFSLILNLK